MMQLGPSHDLPVDRGFTWDLLPTQYSSLLAGSVSGSRSLNVDVAREGKRVRGTPPLLQSPDSVDVAREWKRGCGTYLLSCTFL